MDESEKPGGSDMDLYIFLKTQLEIYSCFGNIHKMQEFLGIAENSLNRMEDPLAREMLEDEIRKYKK